MQALKAMAAPARRCSGGAKTSRWPRPRSSLATCSSSTPGIGCQRMALLLAAANLRVDEASLTGESTAVGKEVKPARADAGIGDRKNMVFAGTVMTYGRGQAVVTATGMETEFGRIAKMLQQVEEDPSPLADQDGLHRKAARPGLPQGLGCGHGTGHLPGQSGPRDVHLGGEPGHCRGPRGPGGRRDRCSGYRGSAGGAPKAIIRRLPAVETLGCTTVICSDKTGTLTENEMTVRKLFAGGRPLDVTGVGYEPTGSSASNGGAVAAVADPAATTAPGRGALQRYPLRRVRMEPPEHQGGSHRGGPWWSRGKAA